MDINSMFIEFELSNWDRKYQSMTIKLIVDSGHKYFTIL